MHKHEAEKSSLFPFIPAESFFSSSVSFAVLPESDIQKANQMPNLVKNTTKLPHLTKVSCICEQLSLNPPEVQGSPVSLLLLQLSQLCTHTALDGDLGWNHSCKAPAKSQINLLVPMFYLMLWVAGKKNKKTEKKSSDTDKKSNIFIPKQTMRV